MNKIEAFEQFLASGSVQFSILNFSINIILTMILSYLLSLLYSRYGKSLSNRKSFGQNFVMLAVTTMIIITIVKSSLALSLGLVGALSIVRFRAAIKEPEELTYLFLNIAIGLGFGADQKMATFIGFIFIVLFLIGRKTLSKNRKQENKNLIITISTKEPVKNQILNIVNILKQYSVKIDLKRFDENESKLEASFIIEFDNFEQINEAKNILNETYNNLTISFIDNNLNI